MKKRILISVCAILVITILLAFLQALVVPKYRENPEGALIREYYAEAGGHDVLFVGDCEVYESIVPAVLWEQYGISSYIRGSAQQLAWQSYYLMEESFRYEKPQVVVFNVLALKYGTPQSEAFNRMTLDGMKWSGQKIGAIRASLTAEEQFLDYVFPILRFHSRITSLTADDLRYLFRAPSVSQCGYLMQTAIRPMGEPQEGARLSDYTLPAESMAYLDRMRKLCEENGAELILMKAPTNSWAYWWYDEWEEQIADYAAEHGLAYYNFIESTEQIGIDWSHDTYDEGVHLNVYGAEKLSRYFGEILREKHKVADRRENATQSVRWTERVNEYYAQKQSMEEKTK